MKNHAGLILGIRMGDYYFTPEEEEWIRQEYPKVGTAQEKADAFNAYFGTKRKAHCISEKARRMGVKLSDESRAEYKRRSAEHIVNYNRTVKAKPIGYVGRPANGYLTVKTDHGWVMQTKYEYEKSHGELKDGHVVILLDGNRTNVSADNLMAVPRGCQALMTANKFWSEEPNLTKTGAIWSELYLLLKEQA